MFVQIKQAGQSSVCRDDIAPDMVRTSLGDLEIIYQPDPLYGFSFQSERFMAIGEAIRPVTTEEISGLLELAGRREQFLTSIRDGLFAIVVVDRRCHQVLAAQSIASCRPYYYCQSNTELFFSTSLKMVCKHGHPLQIDEQALPEFLVYRHVLPERTLFAGVRRLLGGNLIVLSPQRWSVDERWRWPLDSKQLDVTHSEPEVMEHIRGIIRAGLDRALRGRAATVLFSGGLDSSLMAMLAREDREGINSATTSFSFINRDDQEEEYARTSASALDLPHSIYVGDETGYLAGLAESVVAAEEPLHHLQSVMLYLLFKNHQFGDKPLLLCGHGADALFGNDAHLRTYKYRAATTVLRATGLEHLYRWGFELLRVKSVRWRYFTSHFGRVLNSPYHMLWGLGQYTSPQLVSSLFGSTPTSVYGPRADLVRCYASHNLLNQITLLTLLGDCHITLSVWSKLAESQGYPVYYPFTEPELIEYLFSLPWSLKLSEPKYLIRRLLRDDGLEEGLIERPKMSFGFPPQFWALPGTLFQPLVDMAGERYEPSLLSSLQSTDQSKAMLLWNLLVLYLIEKLIAEAYPADQLAEEITDRHRHMNRSSQ
jgi:asparagine synthase (glutamine-hydrolysing)